MIIEYLSSIWADSEDPFFISNNTSFYFNDLLNVDIPGIDLVEKGDVVALIGDFDIESIATLLRLFDKGAIVVPLSLETKDQHPYFFEASLAQFVFNKNVLSNRIFTVQQSHPMLDHLRELNHSGLILFTSGSTGLPKAILHDLNSFLSRYTTPRPPLRSLSFLLFDHIGGINTLLHMLYNKGQIISPKDRNVGTIIKLINAHAIELLPTTPTFLRMLSLTHDFASLLPSSLKIISYGTERMDQITLDTLCRSLPYVKFKQTYGMSELGILRIHSKANNSLFMLVGGENVETKIVDNILYIRSKSRMIGYLNSDDPFDSEGWYCTKDIVEKEGEYIRIVGRDSDIVNIGGLKFLPSEVEAVALELESIKHVKAYAKSNPITGQHVELVVEPLNIDENVDHIKFQLKKLFADKLPKHMIPSKISIKSLNISHRFKKI